MGFVVCLLCLVQKTPRTRVFFSSNFSEMKCRTNTSKKKIIQLFFFQRQENNDLKKRKSLIQKWTNQKKGKKFHTNRNGFAQAFLHTTKRINRLDKQFRLVSTCYFFP